jgi:hypothetical protein
MIDFSEVEPAEIGEESDELGPPESIEIDVNAVIHALQRNWSEEVAQMQWDKAQLRAQTQEMQQRWQRAEAMKTSLEEALAAEITHSNDLEERLNKALALLERGATLIPDPGPESQPDAFLAASERLSIERTEPGPAESSSPTAQPSSS